MKRAKNLQRAIKLAVDVVAPRRLGNIPIIDYTNKEGLVGYETISDKYATEIIKMYKDKK